MSLENAMDISVSGIQAERIHMELIASNLANINSTRSISGGPYRRKIAVFDENILSFDHELMKAEQKIKGFEYGIGGVRVSQVVEDMSTPQKVYDPSHPDADSQGYVSLPNISLSKEMVDLIYVSKLYDANITAFNAIKKMEQDALQLQ